MIPARLPTFRSVAVIALCTLGSLCAVAPLCAVAWADRDIKAPRTIDWDELRTREFDLRWVLPEDRGPSLASALERALAVQFEAWTGVDGQPAMRTTGDLIAACKRLRERPAERDRLLRRFAEARPAAHRQIGRFVPALVRDELLRTEDWDPDTDSPNDGLLVGKSWTLEGATTAPWNAIGGDPKVYQGATLYWADLATIKEVENDYGAYMGHVAHSYEFVHALGNTYVAGTDPEERPFAALRIEFQCDLPFPYGVYDCELHILNRVDARGRLVCDIYSTSKDFYWMAGRDKFLQVETSDGAWVGTIAVREFGFDLRSVPDGGSDRESSIRSTLGNLKRRADALFTKRGGTPRADGAVIPVFPVTGLKR